MFRWYGELTIAHQYKDHMLLPSSYNYLVVNTTWLQTFAKLLYLTYFQIHAISASFRTVFQTSGGLQQTIELNFTSLQRRPIWEVKLDELSVENGR